MESYRNNVHRAKSKLIIVERLKKLRLVEIVIRLNKARKAGIYERGLLESESYKKIRDLEAREQDIENTLLSNLSEQVDKLYSKEILSFEFSITKESYSIFISIMKLPQFKNLNIEKLDLFRYRVKLGDSNEVIY